MAWTVLTWVESRLIADLCPTIAGWSLFSVLCVVNWLIVSRPIQIMRSIEIRPDGMILDCKDVFQLEAIGDNWPAFTMKDDDPPSPQ